MSLLSMGEAALSTSDYPTTRVCPFFFHRKQTFLGAPLMYSKQCESLQWRVEELTYYIYCEWDI